jgi:hypothetical protein
MKNFIPKSIMLKKLCNKLKKKIKGKFGYIVTFMAILKRKILFFTDAILLRMEDF